MASCRVIAAEGAWEGRKTDYFVEVMDEYAQRKGLSRADHAFVDIGSNIGWFGITCANYGVQV